MLAGLFSPRSCGAPSAKGVESLEASPPLLPAPKLDRSVENEVLIRVDCAGHFAIPPANTPGSARLIRGMAPRMDLPADLERRAIPPLSLPLQHEGAWLVVGLKWNNH